MQRLKEYKNIPIGEIPHEWKVDTIKNVSDKLVVGFVGICDPYYTDDTGIPMIRTTNVKEGFLDLSNLKYVTIEFHTKNKKSQLQENDLIVARHGQNGTACLVKGLRDANCLSVVIIRPSLSLFLPKYFEYAFNSPLVRKQIAKRTGGGVQTVVNTAEVAKTSIMIPPMDQQKRIASILSKVDGLIQKTDQIIEQTQRLKKGLMQKLLTKGIKHDKFNKTDLGMLPENWRVIELHEALKICQYGLSETLSFEGKYPIFRMNNIIGGFMVTNEMKYVSVDDDMFERFKLNKGDLLFNRTNSMELVGKTGIFLLDGDFMFASYLIRLTTKEEVLDSFFLNLYLNTDFTQYRLKSIATPGVSQVNINASNLKSMIIPLPSVSEQKRIVSIVSSIERKRQSEISRKQILSRLKHGLMQNLLTGKIRVKV